MRRLERRHDALQLSAELERREGFFVRHRDVLDPLDVAQERVLRSHARIVEPGRDGMGRQDLAVAILQHVRIRAVQNTRTPADQ